MQIFSGSGPSKSGIPFAYGSWGRSNIEGQGLTSPICACQHQADTHCYYRNRQMPKDLSASKGEQHRVHQLASVWSL